MSNNFYYNIKNLKDNNYIDNTQLTNALLKNFITVEEYQELIGSTEDALTGVKTVQIAKTKSDLSTYLATHPYVDPETQKKYSVTFEKQSLLANEIASCQLATAAKQPYQLTWNTTGEECVNFTFEEISKLALAISAYVKPMVSYQQSKEVEIRNAKTIEDVLAITTDFASITA